MRLDMPETRPLGSRNPGKRRHLVQDNIFNLLRTHIQLATPKPLQIREPRMRPHSDTRGNGKFHRSANHARISRMKPAGDVGRRDVAEQRFVVSKLICTKRFANIRIQIDDHSYL
jgi:hypothetical protein